MKSIKNQTESFQNSTENCQNLCKKCQNNAQKSLNLVNNCQNNEIKNSLTEPKIGSPEYVELLNLCEKKLNILTDKIENLNPLSKSPTSQNDISVPRLQEQTRKYKKMGNCKKLVRCNADRYADLLKFNLEKWVELILTVHPYLPAIANLMEQTIDKIAYKAYYSTSIFGGTEACFCKLESILDNKINLINLYVLGNNMKLELTSEELKVIDCTINHHSKINDIAKPGRYRKVYLMRDAIISKLASWLKINGFRLERLIGEFGKLNIVLYYV